MSAIVCLIAIGILLGYQVFLVVTCSHPTLRKKYLEHPSTKGYMYPEAIRATRSYVSNKRYDYHTLGV
jgi:hypothetical protein